jgi:ParB family chromosome partitioning protein
MPKPSFVEPAKSIKNKPSAPARAAASAPVVVKPAPVKKAADKPEPMRSRQKPEPEWSTPKSEFLKVRVESIDDSGYNSRLEIDENAPEFADLCASVRAMGVIEPIIVTPLDDIKKNKAGLRFDLVAGFRRYRALKKTGLRETWAVIHHYTHPTQRVIVNLLENQHRQSLRAYEEALAFKKLRDEGFRTATIADKLAISETKVNNYVSCVENLIPELLDVFRKNSEATTLSQLIQLSRADKAEQESFFRALSMTKPEVDKDKGKDKPKEEKAPKVKNRDQVRGFLGDLTRAESILVDGDEVYLGEEDTRRCVEAALRWVIGEVRFPLVLPPSDKSERMRDEG